MSSEIERIHVTVIGDPTHCFPGEIEVTHWDKSASRKRGLRALLWCWGIALLTVLIPIVHFVVPPLLLIAGPIAMLIVSRQTRVISGGTIQCPLCEKQVLVRKAAVEWPLRIICDNCDRHLKIETRPN